MLDLKKPWAILKSEFDRIKGVMSADARVSNRILKKRIDQSTYKYK